ncbi:MAG: hypothetical protein CISAcid_11010 [uncultured Acidilobus sp. CIS]|jgi:hypothetical protein|nr:MAG: hypothetical protein CISAcid_11010 [uncultured Acidilobus sp. CIS]
MKSSILDFLLCCGGEGALCSSLPWAFSSFSRFFMKASRSTCFLALPPFP